LEISLPTCPHLRKHRGHLRGPYHYRQEGEKLIRCWELGGNWPVANSIWPLCRLRDSSQEPSKEILTMSCLTEDVGLTPTYFLSLLILTVLGNNLFNEVSIC
ncbi:unnamed protein product, partial [Meganyctiphanes norvegica]